MIQKKMPSGATLELQIADFDDGEELYQTVARELVGAGILPKADQATVEPSLEAIRSLLTQDVNNVADVALKFIASKPISICIRRCMQRHCTYRPASMGEGGGVTITSVAETFGPEEARGDYQAASWEVMVLNLRPFWKSVLSMFSTLFKKPESASQK